MAHIDQLKRGSPGFSLLELLMVVLVTALMVGVVIPVAGSVQRRMSLTNAKNSMVFLGARARSHAANRGALSRLVIDPNTNLAAVRFGTDTLTDARVDYEEDHSVELEIYDLDGSLATLGRSRVLVICYSPRGYAQPGCAGNPFLPVRVRFTRDGKADSVEIRPLGQIEVFE